MGLDYQAGLWDWNSGVLAPKPMLAGTDNMVFLITNLVLNLSLLDVRLHSPNFSIDTKGYQF